MISLLAALVLQSDIAIPGFTAYSEPDSDAIEMDEQRGFVKWTDPSKAIVWHGKLLTAGDARVRVRFEGAPANRTFRMTVDRQVRRASVKDDVADFGTFRITKPGYEAFKLEALGRAGSPLGVPTALLLNGPALAGAQFNLKPRRNAASVHLGYPIAEGVKATRFYAEVEAREDPLHTYYEVCGFRRGYFGIQVNSPTERRIIFSIWDAGSEAVDRGKVADENRVKLLEKGEGVVASDFGSEGTGGHSHLVYPWKKGQTYRLMATAKPVGNATEYAGYFWFPETKTWGIIAKFRAPKDGGYLKGLYSFNENFWGTNGNLKRAAVFKNQWIQLEDGSWQELTKARFTCDGTGKADRFDYLAKPFGEGFWLQNGGYEDNGIKLGDVLDRKATGVHPTDMPTN